MQRTRRLLPVFAVLLALGFAPIHAQTPNPTTTPNLGFTPTGPATVVGTGSPPPAGVFATSAALSDATAKILALQTQQAALQQSYTSLLTQFAGINSDMSLKVLDASKFGLKGDGHTDNTNSLVSAIVAARAGGYGILHIGPGIFNVLHTWQLYAVTGGASAFIIEGSGTRQGNGSGLSSGTIIQMDPNAPLNPDGSLQDAVIQMGGFTHGWSFRDLTIGTNGRAVNCVHFTDTRWTAATFNEVEFDGASTGSAILMDYGTGNADGECLLLFACRLNGPLCGITCNTGQAYSILMLAGEISLPAGGHVIKLTNAGHKAMLQDVSVTYNAFSTANAVYDVGEVNQISATGCRIEKACSLFSIHGGSPNDVGILSATDCHMTSVQEGASIIQGGNTNNQQWQISLSNMLIDGKDYSSAPLPNAKTRPTIRLWDIGAPSSNLSQLRISNTHFINFAGIDAAYAPTGYSGVLLDNVFHSPYDGSRYPLQKLTN